MPRLLAILVFLSIVEPTISRLQTCLETCPDDGSDGTCPPDCSSCLCCAHVFPSMTVSREAVATMPPAATRERFVHADTPPPSREPDDIFHVPKPLHG